MALTPQDLLDAQYRGVLTECPSQGDRLLRCWDAGYRLRAQRCGTFLITQAEWLNLTTPPILSDDHLRRVFGRIPGMQNPPKIQEDAFSQLSRLLDDHR